MTQTPTTDITVTETTEIAPQNAEVLTEPMIANQSRGKKTWQLAVLAVRSGLQFIVMAAILIASGYLMNQLADSCLLYTSPSPRDLSTSRMPSSA